VDELSAVRPGEDLLDLSVPIDVTVLPPLPQVQSNISAYITVHYCFSIIKCGRRKSFL
jgi:hypothetical protein